KESSLRARRWRSVNLLAISLLLACKGDGPRRAQLFQKRLSKRRSGGRRRITYRREGHVFIFVTIVGCVSNT
ncbi:MAG TPA: hypothetical protein VF766_11060, partial [Pyrinomonadaceae bacterium]